jgi:hypothetical protein
MKATTIDRLDLKDHVRWAQDQHTLDTSLIAESLLVAPHPEVTGISCIYPSKFDELFDLQKANQPWAAFHPPKNFHLFGRRFFSYCLFSSIKEKRDEEDEDEQKPQGTHHYLIQRILRTQQHKYHSSSLFEKDKTTLLNALESIRWIESLLKQIYGRKLQYQKG